MNRNISYYIKNFLFILLVTIIIGYTLYQIRYIIFGPKITIISPVDGQTYNKNIISIKGIAKNTSSFLINDNPILIDTLGTFNQALPLSPGYNIIKLSAQDKFGSKKEIFLRIILKEDSLITTDTVLTDKQLIGTTTKDIASSTNL